MITPRDTPGVVLDFDGVIVRSMELHAEAYRRVLQQFGIDFPDRQIFEREGATCERRIVGGVTYACENMHSSLLPGDPAYYSGPGWPFPLAHSLLPDIQEAEYAIAHYPQDTPEGLSNCIPGRDRCREQGPVQITTYSGSSTTVAALSDPAPADDQYLSANSFNTWVIHDPAGDDCLIIGGQTVCLNPGDGLTLQQYGIRADYVASAEGGNEWRIGTTDGSNHVFVSPVWEVLFLDY